MNRMIFLIAVLAFSCSTKRVQLSNQPGELKDVLSYNSPFIKVKSEIFSTEFTFHNLSKTPIIIYLHDVTCAWGKQMGTVRNDRPFNIGEKVINIYTGGVKTAKMRCTVPDDGEGELSFTVKKVYSNPNGDGVNTGGVIGENIVWKYNQPKD